MHKKLLIKKGKLSQITEFANNDLLNESIDKLTNVADESIGNSITMDNRSIDKLTTADDNKLTTADDNKLTTTASEPIDKLPIADYNKLPTIANRASCDNKCININTEDIAPRLTQINYKKGNLDIYVINLKHRTDRLTNVLKEFKRLNFINLIIFDAYQEHIGLVGCAKSHLALINYAKMQQMKYIYVIEDDCCLKNDISNDEYNNIFNELNTNYDKFDMFNGSPSFYDYSVLHNGLPKKVISPINNFFYMKCCQVTNFMVYSENVYAKIINEYIPHVKNNLHIDQYYAQNFVSLAFRQYIANQIIAYSDIANCITYNYNYLCDEEQRYKATEQIYNYVGINVQGELENVMFQIATAYAYAKRTNKILYINKLDTMLYIGKEYEFLQMIPQLENIHTDILIDEKIIKSNKIDNYCGKNVLLNGFFCNEEYFDEFKNELCDLFNLKQKFVKYSGEKACFLYSIVGKYATFVNNNINLNYYYKKSIDLITKKHKDTIFYIIGDDVANYQNNDLFKAIDCVFISSLNKFDLIGLMSICKYGGICANNLCSWWGAYLNKNDSILFPNVWDNLLSNNIYQKNSTIINVSPIKMTIVTGYWTGFRNKYSDISSNKYLDWFKNTLNINCPYIFFGNDNSISILKKYRNKNYLSCYVNFDIDQFDTYKFIDDINIDSKHCPCKELGLIWNEKINLMCKAVEMNPYDSDWFMWCDAGICTYRDIHPDTTFFPNETKLNKLKINCINVTTSDKKYFDKSQIGKYYHYISGTFIMHRKFINKYNILYNKYLEKYIKKKDNIYTDQVIHTLIYNDYPDMFNIVEHGYGQILNVLL
jgi:hypothetical protein